ncbi:MAG: TonB-dependent siderophore myxochelin receptor MxcH [Byssovorax sp.]
MLSVLVSSRPARAEEPVEIQVRGDSAATRHQRSAEAVSVVETAQARRGSADLGDVLGSSPGVSVRRTGGVGSSIRLSLNGFEDDQIRFFIDGIPLPYAGFGFGIANVPIDFAERVEVYRGVVPIRFGADALGGAINLVTDAGRRGTRASASYEVGSFGTYRTTLAGQYNHAPSGLFARVNAFYDLARNDYPVDVEVADERGRLVPATVTRFHDAYRAHGVGGEVGLTNQSWAKRLSLRVYTTEAEKELQNNLTMTVKYGDVSYAESSRGATLRYRSPSFGPSNHPLWVEAAAGYAYRSTDFVDRGTWVYDWFGHRIRERASPGEISGTPTDQVIWQHDTFGRAQLSWVTAPSLILRASLAPTLVARSGRENLLSNPGGRDPLTAQRDLFTLVSGLEAELSGLDTRIQNVAFLKDYFLDSTSEEVLPGFEFNTLERSDHSVGGGDALRVRFTDWLYAKASYEHTTRLPSPNEIFGNGVLIVPNLELEPETSDNGNGSLTVEANDTPVGQVRAEVNGFARFADNLVVLLGNDRYYSYQNVFSARSVGVEGSLGYRTPGDYLALAGSFTVQDSRNTSDDGAFRDYAGDRIPNRPWLFGSASARAQLSSVLTAKDEISLTWSARYTHEFFRSWESQGAVSSKQIIPSQLLHSLGLTYLVRGPTTISSTLEVQNLTDEKAFDYFGAQRPGRAFFFKATLEHDVKKR